MKEIMSQTTFAKRDVSIWTDHIFPHLETVKSTGYANLEIFGAERIPKTGRIIYVGNHSGWFALDAFWIALAIFTGAGFDRMPYTAVFDPLLKTPYLRQFL